MTIGSTGIGSCDIKEKQNSGDGAKCVGLELKPGHRASTSVTLELTATQSWAVEITPAVVRVVTSVLAG